MGTFTQPIDLNETLTRLARIMHRLRLRSPATVAEKREWAAIRRAASAARSEPDGFYTITEADLGQPFIRAFMRVWAVVNFLGRVLPSDVGKRVSLRDGVLQVESSAQRDARLAPSPLAVDTCECADVSCKAAPWHKGVAMQVHGETLFEGSTTCGRPGEVHLFRMDMGDARPVVFCDPCGDDALDSGVFAALSDLCDKAEERQILAERPRNDL